MKYRHPSDHPYFPLLLVWRGILAVLALHAVLDKPFEAMLMALAVLGLGALTGELLYARKVQGDNERLRQQAEREWREQRAADARQRFEAVQAAQEEGSRKSFGLDEAEVPEAGEIREPELAALSAEEFDLALTEAELERRGR